jgi:predicted DNA-binding WGR domain protein
MAGMKRYSEYLDDDSHKFWEAELQGVELTLRYGPADSSGQTRTKAHADAAAARRAFDTACAAKEKSGYVQTDPDFGLGIRAQLREARETGRARLDLRSAHPDALAEVFTLTALTDLRITSAGLTALPEAIGNLEQLECLVLDHNQLTTLPEAIGRLGRLSRLDARGNRLERLPDSIGDLVALESLDLRDNKLSGLPESIGRLARLEDLDLSDNALTALPESLGALGALEKLDLSDNPLTRLPESIGGLRALTELDLDDVPLEALPDGLCDCTKLRELKAGGYRFSALPADFGRLVQLQELQLSGSWNGRAPLSALPGSFGRLTALAELDLSNASLTHVPEVLRALPALDELDLSENPIEGVDEDLLDDKRALFDALGWDTVVAGSSLELPAVEASEAARERAARADAIKALRRKTDVDEAVLDGVLAFVFGETDTRPVLSRDEADELDALTLLLRPVAEWSFVDERLLAVFASVFRYPEGRYHDGFYEPLCKWLKTELDARDTPAMFGTVAAMLERFEVPREAIVHAALDDLTKHIVGDAGATSLGRWLLDRLPELGLQLSEWAAAEQATGAMTSLYAEAGVELEPHLVHLLPYKEYDGKVHPPMAALAALARHDAERYAPRVDEAIARGSPDCPSCVAEMARLLADSYGDARRAQAIEQARRTLDVVRDVQNRGERVWMKFEGFDKPIPRFVDWMLRTFGAEVGDLVLDYVRDTRRLDLDVIETAARHLGQRAIGVVGEALKMQLDAELGPHYERVFRILRPLDTSTLDERIWALTACRYPDIQGHAARFLGHSPRTSFEPARERLGDDDPLVRAGAARVLVAIGDGPSLDALRARLDEEPDDVARDWMVAAVYATPTAIPLAEAQRRIEAAARRGKLKAALKRWLEPALPALRWSDGAPLDAEALRFLAYRQVRTDAHRLDPELRDVVAHRGGLGPGPVRAAEPERQGPADARPRRRPGRRPARRGPGVARPRRQRERDPHAGRDALDRGGARSGPGPSSLRGEVPEPARGGRGGAGGDRGPARPVARRARRRLRAGPGLRRPPPPPERGQEDGRAGDRGPPRARLGRRRRSALGHRPEGAAGGAQEDSLGPARRAPGGGGRRDGPPRGGDDHRAALGGRGLGPALHARGPAVPDRARPGLGTLSGRRPGAELRRERRPGARDPRGREDLDLAPALGRRPVPSPGPAPAEAVRGAAAAGAGGGRPHAPDRPRRGGDRRLGRLARGPWAPPRPAPARSSAARADRGGAQRPPLRALRGPRRGGGRLRDRGDARRLATRLGRRRR